MVESASPGYISVSSNQTPLSELLHELERVVSIEALYIDPTVEKNPVTVSLENLPLDDALDEILQAAKVNYAVWGGRGKPYRLFVGSPETTAGPGRNRPVRDPPERAESPPAVAPELAPGVAPESRQPSDRPSPPRPDRDPRASPLAPRVGRPVASGEASLSSVPTPIQLARVGEILALGLLLGWVLVPTRR